MLAPSSWVDSTHKLKESEGLKAMLGIGLTFRVKSPVFLQPSGLVISKKYLVLTPGLTSGLSMRVLALAGKAR